jgi:hypothetical protein
MIKNDQIEMTVSPMVRLKKFTLLRMIKCKAYALNPTLFYQRCRDMLRRYNATV